MRYLLLVLWLVYNGVQAEVFQLPSRHNIGRPMRYDGAVNDEDAQRIFFEQVIATHMDVNNQLQFPHGVDPFNSLGGNWQMPGFSMFIPAIAGVGINGIPVIDQVIDQQVPDNTVLVAKKRPMDQANPQIQDPINVTALVNALRYSSHTERQLVVKLLRYQAQGVEGRLWVFTADNPCQHAPLPGNADNQGIACRQFYNILAQLFPNIQFRVYFKSMSIDPVPIEADDNLFEKVLYYVFGHPQENIRICPYFRIINDDNRSRFRSSSRI